MPSSSCKVQSAKCEVPSAKQTTKIKAKHLVLVLLLFAVAIPSDSIDIVTANAMKNNLSRPTQCCQQGQQLRIFLLALISRGILLIAMATSCSIIPDLYPGDDVLQFNMRLEDPKDAAGNACFCLQGHACDDGVRTRRYSDRNYLCADDDIDSSKQRIRYDWLDQFYSFVLPPITKWDAARFLTLSVDPWARYSPQQTTCSDVEDETTTCNATTADEYNKTFDKSEQAHAFLPLFPLIIRYTTALLMKLIPHNLLPSTYEATIAITAIIVNMLAFAIAAVSLYDLTIFVSMRNDLTTSKEDETNTKTISYCDIAKTTAELFCVNPAGVFFTSAYSESVFAMLTFAGHAIAARGMYYNASLRIKDANSIRFSIRLETFYWVISTLLWASASYVRSNGTFSSIWWMLIGIGQCSSYIYTAMSAKQNGNVSIKVIATKCALILCCYGTLALAVAAPVFYHDKRGYRFHCDESSSSAFNKPEWCIQAEDSAKFSLYAYVQRKHWNVGLLRYYEVKQMPNFILAMPILLLSFCAAACWIATSWKRHIARDSPGCKKCVNLTNICWWAFQALSSSSASVDSIPAESNSSQLLLGPSCLPYYAILAGFALVGTFVAHVQISTRLICSSCPALYWFVTILLTNEEQNDKERGNNSRTILTTHSIWFYFGLYNILGIIMHVNWLPWT